MAKKSVEREAEIELVEHINTIARRGDYALARSLSILQHQLKEINDARGVANVKSKSI